ncbi:hypothetical protein K2173_016138 [Erythroxylum novogranatense]|uniref:Copper transport protein n=1 Tax=Erythroxylum novogranatense TaxID=1862640 RepID=A0AAV8SFF1_9ROSI|nr:hypothetical protein K2173_016138 [Erythroxylum novogranatense]
MMHMTFYWGRQVTLLVDAWRTTSWLDYSLTLLACVLAGAFYQFLEHLRTRLKIAASGGGRAKSSAVPPTEEPLLQTKLSGPKFSGPRVAGALLFGFNSAIGYLLMLAVMSFNGGVFLAVVAGLAIGYFWFRSEEERLALVDGPCACA